MEVVCLILGLTLTSKPCSHVPTSSFIFIENVFTILYIYNYAFIFIDSTRIWNNPYTGQIRLTGGEYSNQGLLEIYCNGQWGTVCDDTFSGLDALVACEQLGYNDYNDYNHLSM